MTTIVDRSAAYCVIGAGAGGISAAKNLMQYGIEVDVIEASGDVGGQWNPENPASSAYRSIHLITSKPYIQYPDFPIPAEFPTYLGRRHALSYLRSYATRFGVMPRIEFHRTVERVDRQDGSPHWAVDLDGGERRRYAGVVIANGHLWKPRMPDYPGHFDGTTMHSKSYRSPEGLAGKRVLVVGGGTSAADIAVESSQVAEATFLSIRRGCYYWPKYLFGLPTDVVYEMVLRSRLPLSLVRFFGGIFIQVNSAGNPARYGLPKPQHKLLEEHFVINSALLYTLGHGEIAAKPDIAELKGDRVAFTDGTEEQVDVIVYATGYHQAEFPFIDHKHLNWVNRTPNLHYNAFHPTYDNLFVIGYFQTSTGNWQVMDYQSQVMARYVHLLRTDPQRVSWFRKAKSRPLTGTALTGRLKYYDSERHWLQVEHYSYRAALKKMIRRMPAEPPGPATVPAPAELVGTPISR
jgi:cation diffusion facilitator CzcD-associated flavoprotein CzcO